MIIVLCLNLSKLGWFESVNCVQQSAKRRLTSCMCGWWQDKVAPTCMCNIHNFEGCTYLLYKTRCPFWH